MRQKGIVYPCCISNLTHMQAVGAVPVACTLLVLLAAYAVQRFPIRQAKNSVS